MRKRDNTAIDIKDYKERHIPHRMNVLLTFRERFYPLSDKQREYVRDLHRCCKDVSVAMMRLLLEELGVKFNRKDELYCCELPAGRNRLEISAIRTEGKYDLIVEVLKFGNRAIAHITPSDVDHNFRDREGDKRLVEAVNYVEQKVVNLIYGSETAYKDVMALDGNNMHRDRFNLMFLIPQKAP